MARKFLDLTFTPAVRAAQAFHFGVERPAPGDSPPDALTPDEIAFIGSRDSFYISTVNETGWPYVQHRGGPAGFLKALSPTQLAFADYKGNRQLLTTGNLAVNDRVCLFLMDYPRQARLKILGKARVLRATDHPELVEQYAEPALHQIVERLMLVDVVSFDWNCPKYITPRYTREEVEMAIAPLRERIAELEKLLAGVEKA